MLMDVTCPNMEICPSSSQGTFVHITCVHVGAFSSFILERRPCKEVLHENTGNNWTDAHSESRVGKIRHLLTVSDKGPYDRLKPKWCFNPITWILLVGITHHKPLP